MVVNVKKHSIIKIISIEYSEINSNKKGDSGMIGWGSGTLPGMIVVKVWNRTDSEIKGLRITFSEDFKGRESFIKKIKPKDFKSTAISILDMEKDNNLVLERNDDKVIIKENINSKLNGKVVVINITGFDENGNMICTSEFEK